MTNCVSLLSLRHVPPIYTHQGNLNTTDFAELSAPLLYDMFKAHSAFPLHLAIQHLREDVVFLFLIEHNAQVCPSVCLSISLSVCLSTHLTDCESVYVFANLSVSTSSL